MEKYHLRERFNAIFSLRTSTNDSYLIQFILERIEINTISTRSHLKLTCLSEACDTYLFCQLKDFLDAVLFYPYFSRLGKVKVQL